MKHNNEPLLQLPRTYSLNGKVSDVVLIAINKTKVLDVDTMKYWWWTDINVLLLVQFLSFFLSLFVFFRPWCQYKHFFCFLKFLCVPTGYSSSPINNNSNKSQNLQIARTLHQCAGKPGRWDSVGCTDSSRDAAQPVVVLWLRSQWTRRRWQQWLGSIKSSHQAFCYQNKCIAAATSEGGRNVEIEKVDYIDLKTDHGKLKEKRLWWRYSSDKRQRGIMVIISKANNLITVNYAFRLLSGSG